MQIDRPIAIALIIFIIILIVFFLVMPEYNTFQSLQTELGEKKAEYAAKFDYYSATEAAYLSLQNRPDDVKKIDDALPQNSDFGGIIYYLQKTAKANGLIVKDLFLSKPSSVQGGLGQVSGNVKDLTFSIDVIGDYKPLGNFISALEKSSRVFEITSISFDSATKPPYTFNLQIKTHSY